MIMKLLILGKGWCTWKCHINNIAPYLGLGLNAPVYKNIGLFGEVGAYYTGNP
jgi:hypothetical protein